MRYYFVLSVIIITGLLVSLQFWSTPGASLCWISGKNGIHQVQFSPYFFHRNTIGYNDVKAISIITSPNDSNLETVQIETERLALIIDFINSGWVDDLAAFSERLESIVSKQSGWACRVRSSMWYFSAGVCLFLFGSLTLLITWFRRPTKP